MDARHLDLLRELAERGSVTAVARATNRTPSAVSQQLRTAQRELGTRLVEPAGRGIRLTEAGQLLAGGGSEVAEALARIQSRWDAFRGEPTGEVSVAALPSAATFLLPGVFRHLAQVDIHLRVTDVDIAEIEYARLVVEHDIVIAHSLTRSSPAGTEGLVTELVVREPLDIAMAAGHRLAARASVRAEDVVDERWIGVPLGFPFDAVRLAVEGATGRPVTVVQRIRDNRLIEALVGDSDLLAVLPRFTTGDGGGVALRPLEDVPSARFVFAVLRRDKSERLAVRRVLEAFRAVAATLPR